jgi:large subunit ribosomal protein L3
MCKGLIGKKLGMVSVFSEEGRIIPVTVVEAGPCMVTQIKTKATDGYDALQLGFGSKKQSRMSKPLKGHLQKCGVETAHVLKEVAVDNPLEYSLGQVLNAEIFSVGDRVDVSGQSKGRGFSGVIKRHGFSGGRKTHGSKSHRIPGSVGSSAFPGRVIKGKRLPGHFGNENNTVRNLQIVDIRPDDNLILLKGAVPGASSGMVMIKKSRSAK